MFRLVTGEDVTLVGVAVVGLACLSALVVACSLLAIAAGLVWTNRRGRRRGFYSLPRLGDDGLTPPFPRGCKASADHGQRRLGFDSPLPHSGTPAASLPLAGAPQGSPARIRHPSLRSLNTQRGLRAWQLDAPRGVSCDKAGPTGGAQRGVHS